jgi:excisionase family DNA binding protein
MNPRHAAALSPVMTPKEVAEYLHIHQNTLYKLIHLSEIPSFKIGSDHRFRRSEIEEWIAEKELPRERSRWYRKIEHGSFLECRRISSCRGPR